MDCMINGPGCLELSSCLGRTGLQTPQTPSSSFWDVPRAALQRLGCTPSAVRACVGARRHREHCARRRPSMFSYSQIRLFIRSQITLLIGSQITPVPTWTGSAPCRFFGLLLLLAQSARLLLRLPVLMT